MILNVHTHTHTKMHIHLLLLGSYAYLADPGYLCIKKVPRALQAKLLKPGLELAGEQAILYSKWCGAPEIPPGSLLFLEKQS